MSQGAFEIAGRMQNIGGDDDIEAAIGKALLGRVLFDIEDLVIDEGIGGEGLACLAGEDGRNVGKNVLATISRQVRQQVQGTASGAATDFQDAHAITGRQAFDGPGEGSTQQVIERQQPRRFGIEARHETRVTVREKQLQAVDAAVEGLRQRPAALVDQRQFIARIGE